MHRGLAPPPKMGGSIGRRAPLSANAITARARGAALAASQSGPVPREHPPLSVAPPEQRETYCHECLTENPRTRRSCVQCGARLRHPREFSDDVRDFTPKVSVRTFGNVGGSVLAAMLVAGTGIVMPQWLGENLVLVGIAALVVFALGRFAGRALARQLNEPTVR
jgi:hypothetical protein